MNKRFVHEHPDGHLSQPEGLTAVTVAAARQIVQGQGPFNVVRDGQYDHPGLTRARAIEVVRAMCSKIGVGVSVRVHDAAGDVVFHVKRVATSVYDDPFRDCAGLHGLRQDQGTDYSVSRDSDVYAMGPGVVTTYRTTSGWPWDSGHADGGAYIAYRITDGVLKGEFIYDAEHIKLNPKLKVGDHVDKDTVIAVHLPGFANCEMGFAAGPSGYSPLAQTTGGYIEGQRTWAGNEFDDVARALGAPAGLTEGRRIVGHAPAGWPRWKGRL